LLADPEGIRAMESRACSLLLLLLLLSGAAGAVLVLENRRGDELPARAASFQRLVGGLGFGPALSFSDGASDLDPRLEEGVSMDFGPIVGGGCFRGRRGASVFFYPPLERGLLSPGPENGDALFP
jgi:hypothetical protein